MRKYIEHLTNNLIGENNFGRLAINMHGSGSFPDFQKQVMHDLLAGSVAAMTPEKLGKIMSEFELADIERSREAVASALILKIDGEEVLCQLVAAILSCIIRDRLDIEPVTGMPQYQCIHRSVLGPPPAM